MKKINVFIENLTEWFMHLFYDPVYYMQNIEGSDHEVTALIVSAKQKIKVIKQSLNNKAISFKKHSLKSNQTNRVQVGIYAKHKVFFENIFMWCFSLE